MTSPLSPLAGEVLHRLACESLARMDAIRAANAGPDEAAELPRGYITSREVSEYFGITVNTVEYHTRAGRFPCVKHDGRRYYDPDIIADILPRITHTRGRMGRV